MTSDPISIIRAAQTGDAAATATLCEQLYPRVRRLVRELMARDVRHQRPWLGTMFSTGDVVQEVFLAVIRDLQDIRGRSEPALLAYIATLTKNRIVDAIRFYEASRRDGRRIEDGARIEAVAFVAEGLNPENRAITREQLLEFQRVLATFSERDRTLLRERIENRRSLQAIADLLGYASADSAGKAFHTAQARLLFRLRKI